MNEQITTDRPAITYEMPRQLALYLLCTAEHRPWYEGKPQVELIDDGSAQGKLIIPKYQTFLASAGRTAGRSPIHVPFPIDTVLNNMGMAAALGQYHEFYGPQGNSIYCFDGFHARYGSLPLSMEDWGKMRLVLTEPPIVQPDFCRIRCWLEFEGE